MLLRFLIVWLLCTVAFAVHNEPSTPMAVIKCLLSGVLVAISVTFVPAIN